MSKARWALGPIPAGVSICTLNIAATISASEKNCHEGFSANKLDPFDCFSFVVIAGRAAENHG